MRNLLCALLLLLSVSACATTQAGPNGLADRDPHEELNRSVWGANEAADTAVVRPVAQAYRAVAPRPMRSGIGNFFRNFREPWSFVNNLLQGNPDRAIRNMGRFIVNSTVGIGGLFDVASEIGIEAAPEDFGQTLAVWGVGDGGYRVLPLFGPSSGRDMVGTFVDFIANPTTIFLDRAANMTTLELWAVRGVDIVNSRAEAIDSGVDSFLESSADPYAAARSAYFQTREAEILNYDTAGLAEDGETAESAEDAAFDAALEELEDDPIEEPANPQ